MNFKLLNKCHFAPKSHVIKQLSLPKQRSTSLPCSHMKIVNSIKARWSFDAK